MITQRERYLMEAWEDELLSGVCAATSVDAWLLEQDEGAESCEKLLSAEADKYSEERLKLMESSDYRAQLAAEGKL